MHLRWDGDNYFHTQENPSSWVGGPKFPLRENHTCDTKTEVGKVEASIGQGEKRDKFEDEPAPAFGQFDIVAFVESSYGIFAEGVFGWEGRGGQMAAVAVGVLVNECCCAEVAS